MNAINKQTLSPFHQGEQAIQQRLGVRDKMERFGNQVIRDHMPEQHREFYQNLSYVFIGYTDLNNRPQATMLWGAPGFIESLSPTQLTINAPTLAGDSVMRHLPAGAKTGLLGIDLQTRRRNRLSARLIQLTDTSIKLSVEQAFGNCPQYIQQRGLEHIQPPTLSTASTSDIEHLNAAAIQLIKQSDTFFVASAYQLSGSRNEGADISHRGGQPGFVRVDDDQTLTIPDYAGNFHFNTLGNFLLNPQAGLLFIDFKQGHLLSLSGRAEILWDTDENRFFNGAERLWRFHLQQGQWRYHALPLRWDLQSYSPNTRLTGNWEQAEAARNAYQLRKQWQSYQISRIVDETPGIKSFYLKPPSAQQPQFKAGQYLTLKAMINGKQQIRTYSLSSAPDDDFYRISVKLENGNGDHPPGVFSGFLHERSQSDDTILAKAPDGAFVFATPPERPAVLIAAGIGITPMLSMIRQALHEAVRHRNQPKLTLLCSVRNLQQRAFYAELNALAQQSADALKIYWTISQPEASTESMPPNTFQGRITKRLLQSIIPSQDCDVYLCGPDNFMQTQYTWLRDLDIADANIFSESFGPATLMREQSATDHEPIAEQAVIHFSRSQTELIWSKNDGYLLDFAEQHGLQPDFSCRNGQCGACKVKITQGQVAHKAHSAALNDGEILLCCAQPKATPQHETPKLSIEC